MKILLALFLTSLILAGCSSTKDVYFDIPVELKTPVNKAEFLSKYSQYISGRKIFLDPGHGGNDRNNTGYNGIAVEADLNLHVALALRDYLEEAGAVVIMSRVKDTTVNLKDRSTLANASGAELFISIHHNAPGDHNDDWTNYTSTYFHAKDVNFEYEPCNHDIAKYIQRDLAYAMRNSGGLGSFDGTYSDYMIYPGQGFSVLRLSKIPAVLVECGFNTHHFEARRLVLDEFNEIEAWGIFRGLCRYYRSGIPQIKMITKDSLRADDNLKVSFSIVDSLGIEPNDFKIQLDTTKVEDYAFEASTGILNVGLPNGTLGEHVIRIIAVNKNGNHSFPFYKKINVLKE